MTSEIVSVKAMGTVDGNNAKSKMKIHHIVWIYCLQLTFGQPHLLWQYGDNDKEQGRMTMMIQFEKTSSNMSKRLTARNAVNIQMCVSSK